MKNLKIRAKVNKVGESYEVRTLYGRSDQDVQELKPVEEIDDKTLLKDIVDYCHKVPGGCINALDTAELMNIDTEEVVDGKFVNYQDFIKGNYVILRFTGFPRMRSAEYQVSELESAANRLGILGTFDVQYNGK